MEKHQDQLDALQEIRHIMDRSSRFISLSGLSGIFAGVVALLGAALVKWYLLRHNIDYFNDWNNDISAQHVQFIISVSIAILIVAFITAVFFTARNTRRQHRRPWDSLSKRLLLNILIPLGTGGAFCAVLLYRDLLYLIAPAMLIFYGLALLNGSKYTFGDIRAMAIIEIILGLLGMLYPGYGLLLWTLGFGFLHIAYGALVYYKYERRAA